MQDVPTWGPNKPKKEKRPCFLLAPDAFKGTLSPYSGEEPLKAGRWQKISSLGLRRPGPGMQKESERRLAV
ncbi:MAG: hypothetical protein BSOLF_1163 [Candidatus Carbobacillus altaicus]|uniref:Uncharacterized protein n=1 Tax=Candidatus Carbonibacillus altaicus TaxID=2163959 RepID=A0A2R6Y4K2_9BACL|nr:MAG: hypothetical protein BSOLF_1163 [Candidatus Carbobacillus altaicus]